MMAEDQEHQVTKQLAELYQDAPGDHGVRGVRELSREEIEQIERADRLVIASANAASYQRSREVHDTVIARISELQQADPPGAGEVRRVREAFGSLRQALKELAEKLEESVQEFGSPGEAKKEFAEQATPIRQSPLWKQVDELADASLGSFMLARDNLVVWQRQSDHAVLNPIDVAVGAISAGQAILIHQYVAIEPQLTEAAKRLRQLAAETPGGRPGIVEITIENGHAKQMTPRVLAVDRIDSAMRAARISTQTVDQADHVQAESGPQAESAGDTSDDPSEVEPDNGPSAPEGTGPADDESDEGGDGDRDNRGTGEDDKESSEREGDQEMAEEDESEPPLPVEFSSLFGLARSLDSDLEKVWSAALDETLLEPAVENQLAAVGTLLSALQRKIAVQERELREAGIDARIMEWPLSDASLAELSLDLDVETRQSSLAQLDALVALVETFENLKQPGNVTVTFDQEGESIERFFSAGAFALLKDRLWLLERMTRTYERDHKKTLAAQGGGTASKPGQGYAEAGDDTAGTESEQSGAREEPAEPVEESAEDLHEETERASEGFERLRLGTQAWLHGDPEAAIFHAVVAVAGVLQVPLDQLAENVAEKSTGDQPLLSKEQAAIFARATELVASSQAGSPNLSVAILLAQATLRTAHVLILGPIPGPSLSGSEIAELIDSRQPLRPLEPEDPGKTEVSGEQQQTTDPKQPDEPREASEGKRDAGGA